MDFIRYLLFGAIAAISFILLTRWVEFSQERRPEPLRPAAVQPAGPGAAGGIDAPSGAADRGARANGNTATGIAGPASNIGAVPAPNTIAGAADDDLPTAAEEPIPPPAAPLSERNVISIQTDVLRLLVDLDGGDIVEASLPAYPARLAQPDIPFLLLEDSARRSYIAQSGLVGRNGIDKNGRARYAAQQREYRLAEGAEELVVDLHYRGPRARVVKRMTLRRGDYLVRVDHLVSNRSAAPWQGNLFGQVKRDSTGDPSAELASGMGIAPFLGIALTRPEERYAKFDFEDLREHEFKEKIHGGWVAMLQHYFLSAWIPNPKQTHDYFARAAKSGANIGGFVGPAMAIEPGDEGIFSAGFYVGPKDQYRLKEISEYLDLTVDYGWLWWLAQPLFWLLTNIQDWVRNWGIAIILLTVLIKAAFFQLSAASYRSMANMRRVQPQMAAIRERHGDDRQKQSQAMMELYRKEKINPLGGCLPILVQMPVFIALYWVLLESVELRQAPFFGWIRDLSVMDPYFILPLIMGASMWFQHKLNPPPPDPMQAKIMQWLPVIFTFFFLWFPAGLVLYWVSNNILSIAQQWVITRRIERAPGRR